MIKKILIPPEWDYLFTHLYAKQNYIKAYGDHVKGPVMIYGCLKEEYVALYKTVCLIDSDFKVSLINSSIGGSLEDNSTILSAALLPFSERFFVPDLTGLGFTIPAYVQEKLEELSKKSKPIT